MATPTEPTAAANTNANTKNANTNANSDSHDLHVTWDEETIALHDKERGTRMKIDEPKTPYHTYSGDGGVSPARSISGKEDAVPIEWNELQVKLENVETKQNQNQKSEWDTSDDDGGVSPAGARFAARDAEGKKLEKDPQFEHKRKSHYNEFQAMKMWRQSHPDDDDEEDEEGDDTKKQSEEIKTD